MMLNHLSSAPTLPTVSRPPLRVIALLAGCLIATPVLADERAELEQLRATTLALITSATV